MSPLTTALSFPERGMCQAVLDEAMQMQLRVEQSNLIGTQQPVLEKIEKGYRLSTPVRVLSEGTCITSRIVN